MQAILADPDNDDPRLVYADWCEEQGDLDRATFIRTQVERAKLSRWDARQIELQLREIRLVRQHGATWLSEAPDLAAVTWTGFDGGFVSRARVTSFAALRSLATDYATPLSHVELPWPKTADEGERAPTISTLRHLRINATVYGDEPSRLMHSPLLETLTELALLDHDGEEDSIAKLLRVGRLDRLQRLVVAQDDIYDTVVEALLERDLPALIGLVVEALHPSMTYEQSVFDGFRSLKNLGSLRELVLLGYPLSADAFRQVMSGCTSLRHLELVVPWEEAAWTTSSEIADCTLRQVFGPFETKPLDFFRAPCLRGLRRLELRHAYFADPADLTALLETWAPTLEVLDFLGTEVQAQPDNSRPALAVRRARARQALIQTQMPKLHTLTVGLPDHHLYEAPDLIEWADTPSLQWLRLLSTNHKPTAYWLARAEFPNLKRLDLLGASAEAQATLLDSPLGKRLSESGGLFFDDAVGETSRIWGF